MSEKPDCYCFAVGGRRIANESCPRHGITDATSGDDVSEIDSMCWDSPIKEHVWKVEWQRPPGSTMLSTVRCIHCDTIGYQDG